jgi:hypothetical protein
MWIFRRERVGGRGAAVGGREGACRAVVEKNRDLFASSLEEIGEFKPFEVQLDLKTDQPIFERRRKHSAREW